MGQFITLSPETLLGNASVNQPGPCLADSTASKPTQSVILAISTPIKLACILQHQC